MSVSTMADASQLVRRVGLALGIALLASSPARAQSGWTGPTDLSGPDAYGSPVVGVDADGNALAVWNGATGLQAARYTRASGTWSSPEVLNSDKYAVLRLFVHPEGNAILTWGVINDSDFLVGARAAVYRADTATWSPPTEFSSDGDLVGGVIDRHGNAIVIWLESASSANALIKTAQYNPVAASWTRLSDVSSVEGILFPALALDSNDSAILAWSGYDDITRVERFSPSTSTWSRSVTLPGKGSTNIAVDRLGNATVMWTRLLTGGATSIHAAHYAATTGIWSSLTSLPVSAQGTRNISLPSVASDDAGNTIAVWEWFDGVQWTIQSATYNAASDSWSPAVGGSVPPNSERYPSFPTVGIDASGNATVVWSDWSRRSIEAARRTTVGSWSAHTLAPSGAFLPTAAVDAAGNTIVVWSNFSFPQNVIRSARWRATPEPPAIGDVTSSDGTVSVAFKAVATPPGFANINYEYSLDDGMTWTPRSPASTASPLVLGGLSNGTSYALRLRGVNHAGAGEASAAASVVAGLTPPSDLTAVSIVGNDVTLRWLPTGSVAATGYVLEGGNSPGSVLGSLPIQGHASTVTFPAPTGIFFVRLHATVGGVRSLPSNEIVIRVAVPPPPSAPTGLLGLADRSTLSLAWRNPSTGAAPTGIILDVTGSIEGSFELPLSERFRFASVPAGTYNLAVRAFNTGGISEPSNTVTLTFPGTCSPPSTPTNFSASAAGALIVASWSLPASGSAPTEFVVEVWGSFLSSFQTTGLTWSGAFPQGNYGVRVRATNACGSSTPTPWTTVLVCTSPSGEGCWDYLRDARPGTR